MYVYIVRTWYGENEKRIHYKDPFRVIKLSRSILNLLLFKFAQPFAFQNDFVTGNRYIVVIIICINI